MADTAPYEEWLLEWRASFRRLMLESLGELVNRFEARGDWENTLRAAQRQVAIEPISEAAHSQPTAWSWRGGKYRRFRGHYPGLLAWNARSTAMREAEVNRSIVLALAMEAVNIKDPLQGTVSTLASVAHDRGTRALLQGHSAGVRGAAFSPDGSQVLFGSCLPSGEEGACGAEELIQFDVASGEEPARWTAHEASVTVVAWHQDGERAFRGGGDGSLIIWDMNSHTALSERKSLHDGAINTIAFSLMGSWQLWPLMIGQ